MNTTWNPRRYAVRFTLPAHGEPRTVEVVAQNPDDACTFVRDLCVSAYGTANGLEILSTTLESLPS